MIETHFNQSHIFSKKSLELTFYLFATSYILLQASAYNLGKKYLFYDYHLVYLYFGYSVRYINVNSFQIPLFFCVLFSSPVNKAELTLATQSGSSLPILPLIENTIGVKMYQKNCRVPKEALWSKTRKSRKIPVALVPRNLESY